MLDPQRLLTAYRRVRDELLAERVTAGHWVGELSGSPLATATAVSSLAIVLRSDDCDATFATAAQPLVARGLDYLAATQNPDGGWGDTRASCSNIATTMLVRAAVHLAGAESRFADRLIRAGQYIDAQGGVPGLRRRYGKDKTFAVPILTNCALAGLVDWKEVAPLPFELACIPHPFLRLARLPVVSYAIPALVAVGQAIYFHRKPRNPIARFVRRLAVNRSLQALARMQPDSGGFLEATPLTAFVVMCLAATGRAEHPVVRRGTEFLLQSARPDGSWPIDTNLAAWVTTLSLAALAGSGEDAGSPECVAWLLECQHREVHPFTHAAPGGWGWSDSSGAVPDADDTAGALLALAAFRSTCPADDAAQIDAAAADGIRWLLDLQNADGGWPTFCRGWGVLPFDKSGVDLTAHALRALAAWKREERGTVPFLQDKNWDSPRLVLRVESAIARGFDYLARQQRPDGRWIPLWFGNQAADDEENPVYGTARTLLAYRDLARLETEPAQRALAWLAAAQNPDGGWGGDGTTSSVEETALAVQTLASAEDRDCAKSCGTASRCVTDHGQDGRATLDRGLAWLVDAVHAGRHRQASPIGFYFAKLWYDEKLYPLIFSVGALGAAVRRASRPIPPAAAGGLDSVSQPLPPGL